MTYSEKLRDPRWQKKRLFIMERDGWKCLFCGSETNNLQVHHVVYKRRDPWDYPDYLYQTLCMNCHEERQRMTDKIVDALRIAIAKYPTVRLEFAAQKIAEAAMLEIDLEAGHA